MLLTNSIARIGMLALGLVIQPGIAHEKSRQPSLEWMQVVEPRKKTSAPVEIETMNPVAQLPGLPMTYSHSEATLTQEEMSKALAMRIEAQRALRDIQAKKMAHHRRKGKATWNRELETFLSGQRQIERERTVPKKAPNLKPDSERKSTNPEGHPTRKGRSVFT